MTSPVSERYTSPLHLEQGSQEYTPEFLVYPDSQLVDLHAARIVIDLIARKPKSVLTLPTGSTPIGMYQHLVRAFQSGVVDFSNVTVFNLDEYHPIAASHPASYREFMWEQLFRLTNFNPARCFIPDGAAEDTEAESARYQALIRKYGPPDLAILGIGPGETCHIGFNERGSGIASRVRLVQIDEETRDANARFFGSGETVPTGAFTQGIGDILDSQQILLLAKGAGKAWGINRSFNGEIGSEAPASFLRYHPDVTVMLDEEAASQLLCN